jgi:5-formyltetrahydrofolate cyclo-ligase
MSTPEEIDTGAIIQAAWLQKKRTAVPKADPARKTMDFREIQSLDQVKPMFAGIREPVEEGTFSVVPGDIDLLIVPGLVFSENGYRIGFGGGYYDRYLDRFQNSTAALALECQMKQELPTERFDRPVNVIVTEERVIRVTDGSEKGR